MVTDYSNKANYDGFRPKWETLQRIKTYAEAQNYRSGFIVPKTAVIIKNRDILLINSVLSSYQDADIFEFKETEGFYSVTILDKKKFEKVYSKTGLEYKKYAAAERKKQAQKAEGKNLGTPSFDPETGTLSLGGKDILFTLNLPQYDLLRVVFKEPLTARVWSWDEIIEAWREQKIDQKQQKRKVYDLGVRINNKIAKNTMIKDLLKVRTKDLNINPKYL